MIKPVKFILVGYFLCLFIPVLVFGQTDATIITTININKGEIPPNKWENLIFKNNDTVTIGYSVKTNITEPPEILYRVFLNGKLINLKDFHSNAISFSNMKLGNYILKIQGYANDGWEAKPVVIKLNVSDQLNFTGQIYENKNLFDFNSILFYTVFGFTGLVIITAVIYVAGKSSRKKSKTKNEAEKVIKKFNSFTERKSKDIRRKNEQLNLKINELTEYINHLKKEFKKLDIHNKFLNEQVHDLKTYVSDLETANAQLVEQKEKLAESKHKLEALQEKKEKLFAIAVHDIKNPASAIKGYVELLEGYDLNANEQQEIMQFLIDTSGRIVELAQQMSIVIAKEEPEQELNFQKASIKSIIDKVCNLNFAYAKKKNIKIVNNSSAHSPEIIFDPEKIFEVVDNLISNAIKYSKSETVVQVRSYFNDKKVFVEVIDSGIGIAPEDMSKIFIKGAKLSSKPTGGEESSGLGLWIVKNIIDDHKGKIWVTSKQGIGSTFTFELPILNGHLN